jgi:hypothetical protein
MWFFPRYSLDKIGTDQGIIVDVYITICFPLDGQLYCVPDDGIHILQNQEIPSCSRNITTVTESEYMY